MADRFYHEKADHDALVRKDEMIAEVAAFLDGLAERVARAGYPDLLAEAAADCRAMAEKLRK